MTVQKRWTGTDEAGSQHSPRITAHEVSGTIASHDSLVSMHLGSGGCVSRLGLRARSQAMPAKRVTRERRSLSLVG